MNGPWRSLSVALTANTTGFVGPMTRAATVAKAFGLGVVLALALSMSQAVKFESAMAGVAKTVDATASEMAVLERGIISMANRMPASREEIAGVAEAAGQLGISKAYLLDFTEVAVQLGVTTNLAAADAATGLAKVANVMGTSERDFDRMGATLVELGNNGASTESDILAMAQRLSGIGASIGATEADVFALANALSSMGVEAELGGGAMQRILLKVFAAVDQGGPKLAKFAAVSGMSAEQFAAAWKDDPIQAFTGLVAGINRTVESGGSLTAVLGQLGIKGTQNLQVILKLLEGTDTLTESLEDGRRAWGENKALIDEAEKRYKTLESRLTVLRNQVSNLGRAFGTTFIPYVVSGIDAVQSFGGAMADAAKDEEGFASVLTTVAAAARPVRAALAGLGDAASSTGLSTFSVVLSKVGGFLARTEWLVKAATAAVVLWAGLKAWGVVQAAFYAIQVSAWRASLAITSSSLPANLALVARGIGQVATGIPILGRNTERLSAGMGNIRTGTKEIASFGAAGTTAAMGITLAVGVIAASLAESKRRAKAWRSELEEGIDTTSIESYQDAIDDAQATFESSRNELVRQGAGTGDDAAGFWTRLGASVKIYGGDLGLTNDHLRDTNDMMNEMRDTVRDLTMAQAAASGVLQAYANELGISVPRVVALMKSLELEDVFDVKANLDKMIYGLDEMAEKAGYRGDQVAAASQKSEEVLEEEGQAWEDLEESIRSAFGATFDLTSAFGGRMTIGEVDLGQAEIDRQTNESVAAIEVSFEEASADITGSYNDTLADIAEGFSESQVDIGESLGKSIEDIGESLGKSIEDSRESLGKSLGDIDEDLAKTVADIREELAEAQAELTGDELAEAIQRAREREADAYESANERRADSRESAAEREAEAAEEAAEREIEAAEEAAERQAEAREDAAKRTAEAEEEAALRRTEAEEEAERRIEEARVGGQAAFAEYARENGVTAEQIAEFYWTQTERATGFLEDIQTAFAMGYDPTVISELLQAGPEEAAPIVEALVSDHTGNLVGIVEDGAAAMEEITETAIELARIADTAIRSGDSRLPRWVDEANAITLAIQQLGGQATLDELRFALPDMNPREIIDVIEAFDLLGYVTDDALQASDRFMENLSSLVGADLDIGLTLATLPAEEQLAYLEDKVAEFAESDPEAQAFLDTASADERRWVLAAWLQEWETSSAEATARVDVTDAEQALAALRNQDPINIHVNLLPGSGSGHFGSPDAIDRPGMAAGGLVPGPNVNRDVVPRMLMPGEYVTRKDMVTKWGQPSMAALNAGRVPTGWSVPGHSAPTGYHLTPQQQAVQVSVDITPLAAEVRALRNAIGTGGTKVVEVRGLAGKSTLREIDDHFGSALGAS